MKTVFIRAIEASIDEKAAVLRAAARGPSPARYEVDPVTFAQVPRSPFAYWTGEAVRACFREHGAFETEGRVAKQGLATADDFRFVRLATEVAPSVRSERWFPFAKGGAFSRFYADVYLLVDWERDGVGIKNLFKPGSDRLASRPQNVDFFFRPALTWPLRTQSGLSLRVMPRGCIFGHKGPAAFIEGDASVSLLALLAIGTSTAFQALVGLQMAFGSYEVGVIQRTPVPQLLPDDEATLAELARQSWSNKRGLDTRTETSHAFTLPALLQAAGGTLSARAAGWLGRVTGAEAELASLQAEVDAHAFRLYGLSDEDRAQIERGFDTGAGDEGEADEDERDDAPAELDAGPLVHALLSWSVGAAFGRFDMRLATGERETPPEPEPFDPLPVCSPGMLTGDDGLPVAAPPSEYPLTFPTDGILVDDPGHPRDLVRAARSVFEAVFDDPSARWHEAAELLGAPDLRTFFARDFFEPHIKRYSKSRRKAPIYWQLATASGSYSVWLYIHRATGDTLFRVLNDFVGPKLDHEKAKLDGLTQEAGANPSAAQRREIVQQETFVGELQALKTEVARVAPLWKPNLDDGVILNFAPLWRLVPQSRSWQSECKKAWDKLVAGDYDWAHLAMHLWPERVVPKCIDDRSLAIAHGLEDVFWHEDDSGSWRKSRVDDATVQKLIHERTSTTVKAALKDLLSAATPTASKGRKAKGRRASPRASAPPKPTPAATRASAAGTAVDEATLRAVKAAIASVADGASKADVLAATGLTDGDWNKAIAALLDRGDVTRTGQKRGTRYHADSPGEDG